MPKNIKKPKNTKQSALEIRARELLHERGITLNDIAELVFYLQSSYHEDLSLEVCLHNVDRVIAKREVQNAILTGIQLDILAEKNMLDDPLQQTIQSDESLYGIDEVIAFSIVNVYGSIGFTNYGFIDKQKPGILAHLNDSSTGKVHTFLDDIVGAIAAAASSRLAHAAADDVDLDD